MKLVKNTFVQMAFSVKRRSNYLLIFLNGFLLASLAYFYIEDSYEQKVFTSLADYVKFTSLQKTGSIKTENLITTSLTLTNYLGQGRRKIFEGQDLNSIKSELIHPVSFDLMTGKGACGSYSYILSRVLSELNIPNRIAQMKVSDNYGGHNIVEAQTADGWVVLDPLFNISFKKQDGKMASFSDIQRNWQYYQTQLPVGYNSNYNYAGVRYTNWDKIPVIMPAVKKVLEWTIGKERTEVFSIRTHMLKKFSMLLNIGLILYVLIFLVTLRKFIIRKREAKFFDPKHLFPKRSSSVTLHSMS